MKVSCSKVSCCSSQQPLPTGTTTPASQSKSLEVKPVAAMQEIAVFQGRSVSAEPVTLQSRMGMLPHVSPPLARSGILLI